MSLTNVSSDMITKIFSYNDTNLKYANYDMYINYIKSGYPKFKEMMIMKLPQENIPNYDENINWNYKYHNLLYYLDYLKLMKNNYKLPPLKWDFDKDWKLKYNYVLKYKFPPIMEIKNEKSTILNVTGYKLTHLPEEIGNLISLKELNLTGNSLTFLPPDIKYLTNLIFLTLTNNSLTSLPTEIKYLKKLKVLKINYNNFSVIPPEVYLLPQLDELDLSNNNITTISDEICNLNKLEHLNMNNNNIYILLHQFTQLTNLKRLLYENNNIKIFPKEILNLTKIESLDLNNNYLKYIPDEILNLRHLRHLYLNHNEINRLPDLSTLQYLTYLKLKDNQLTNIVVNYRNLQLLSLDNNPIILNPQLQQFLEDQKIIRRNMFA